MSDNSVSLIIHRLDQLEGKIDKANDAIGRVNDAVGKLAEKSARDSQRIKHVEENIRLAHDRIGVVKKWVIGGLVTIASMAVKHAWSLLESASKGA